MAALAPPLPVAGPVPKEEHPTIEALRMLLRNRSAIAGVVLLLTVLAVSLIGDGLNDAMNPKLRER